MQQLYEISEDGEFIRRIKEVYYGSTDELNEAMNNRTAEFLKELSNPDNSVKEQRNFNIKGHHKCPCGSGKLFKNCHK